ncbi:hypothetical protein [Streptomyces sp. NPDC058653]|uniref:hypothetical protein n=1 Tax=Streptomyces sp. NPDC058653 TaxID=3346576 RepID=UPI00366263A9
MAGHPAQEAFDSAREWADRSRLATEEGDDERAQRCAERAKAGAASREMLADDRHTASYPTAADPRSAFAMTAPRRRDPKRPPPFSLTTDPPCPRTGIAGGAEWSRGPYFRALKQQRIVFNNPMADLSSTPHVRVPAPLLSDRLHGALERLDTPAARLIVTLVAIHALKTADVARLQLDDADLAHHTLTVRRRDGIHTVYLDQFTAMLITARLAERRERRPNSPNRRLIITTHTAHHPARPRLSYTGLRAPFERIGLKPREVWADRVLDEARQTADPVHLVRLFGLHPHTAVKYVHAAHPDKALPRIRCAN